jgi:hypothetical protein
MQRSPGRQTWDQPATRKGIGRRHPERLLVAFALHRGDRCGKSVEAVTNRREQSCSGIVSERGPVFGETGAATILLERRTGWLATQC